MHSENSFKGIYAASLTPMDSNLHCDHKSMARHCKDLIDKGCAGIVLFGTTGEAPSFSVQEKKKNLELLIKEGFEPKRIIFNITSSSIEDTVELAEAALQNRCAAVMAAPPFFYKNVEEQGVIAFYREGIRRIKNPGLKFFLYHIPQCSGVPITLNIIKTLREEFPGVVIGIKESEGNLPFTKQILEQQPGFKVFVGHEGHIVEAVSHGASGGVSGIANAYPELIVSFYQLARQPKLPNHTKELQSLFHILNDYPLIPALKSIIEQKKGSAWHMLRPPLVALNEEKSKTLRTSLRELFPTDM